MGGSAPPWFSADYPDLAAKREPFPGTFASLRGRRSLGKRSKGPCSVLVATASYMLLLWSAAQRKTGPTQLEGQPSA